MRLNKRRALLKPRFTTLRMTRSIGPRFSFRGSKHDRPDHKRGEFHGAKDYRQGAHQPPLEPLPQYSTAQKRQGDLYRADNRPVVIGVPITDRAFKNPVAQRPEMRTPIVVVKQEVQPQVKKGRTAKRKEHW